MTEEMIRKNVETVKAEIARAAREAGRDPAEILLVAATKMNDADSVRAAIRAGVDVCGENRVQEMLQKQAEAPMKGHRCTLSAICRRTRSGRSWGSVP